MSRRLSKHQLKMRKWKRTPNCHFCGRLTDPGLRPPAETAACKVHLVAKGERDQNRGQCAITCHRCAVDRQRERTVPTPIDDKRKVAGSPGRELDGIQGAAQSRKE